MLNISPSPNDIARALDSWKWLNLSGLRPIYVSTFGDVFFQGEAIVMLDTISGGLSQVAANLEEFRSRLRSEEGQEELLLSSLALAAQDRGLRLGPGQCFDFKVMPALGGEVTVEAIEVTSFVVKMGMAGQIHQQIKNLPPGTPIGKITLSD